MELITILNRCHRFRGFVYQHAYFSADKKSIEVAVRPRKGSAAVCSRCHLPAPGYDQLAERRFEFIPLWGFLVFLLYTMWPAGFPLPAISRRALRVPGLVPIRIILQSNLMVVGIVGDSQPGRATRLAYHNKYFTSRSTCHILRA